MATPKRTVLITGCSDGSLGSYLAIAFHKSGLHVYATARNPSKMAGLVALGIETLTLDVLSDSSIAAAVSQIPSLDILVNNAGAVLNMPFSDLSIPEAKKLFDLNVWSYLAVTQAFLPLLLESKGIIANQTSGASVVTIPFQSTYNASKAAMAMFSDSQRLELEPFGVRIIDLKTGSVRSNIQNSMTDRTTLPKGSIYEPAREAVEKTLGGEEFFRDAGEPTKWAEGVVGNLLRKSPPPIIWLPGSINMFLIRLGLLFPFGTFDGTIKKMTGLDIVAQRVGK
ncbi:NADPH-dependent 1-acyldihydroxyacetone phosphate reductase [Lachnellula hyalina]|uniref:NADPH-dependent 1-acyldihydroxyacetone phosphate reductase n=1 Tax=Lachnellula hyalina TaxID=1316788 RepID=A0A8H8QVC8_9HELO|nr:NADPH-dependent 1-acyldihydroxyacetone phosphate reductase [Lachnellula hyalina]TVY23453.1 NADPH-dependent 1-acyldihydroxyacetone phosphate reductase [Lachnellula hyalina]